MLKVQRHRDRPAELEPVGRNAKRIGNVGLAASLAATGMRQSGWLAGSLSGSGRARRALGSAFRRSAPMRSARSKAVLPTWPAATSRRFVTKSVRFAARCKKPSGAVGGALSAVRRRAEALARRARPAALPTTVSSYLKIDRQISVACPKGEVSCGPPFLRADRTSARGRSQIDLRPLHERASAI